MALSDLLQACSNKSVTCLIQHYYYNLNCVVNLVTTLLYIMVATNLLEQPCNKSDNAIKQPRPQGLPRGGARAEEDPGKIR